MIVSRHRDLAVTLTTSLVWDIFFSRGSVCCRLGAQDSEVESWKQNIWKCVSSGRSPRYFDKSKQMTCANVCAFLILFIRETFFSSFSNAHRSHFYDLLNAPHSCTYLSAKRSLSHRHSLSLITFSHRTFSEIALQTLWFTQNLIHRLLHRASRFFSVTWVTSSWRWVMSVEMASDARPLRRCVVTSHKAITDEK